MVSQKVQNKFGNVKYYPYLCIIMKKETIASAILLLFFAVAIIAVCLHTTTPTSVSIEKVRIDSIYSKYRYEVMPEKMWIYKTKRGSFTTNNLKMYNVGDSIEIKVVSKLK